MHTIPQVAASADLYIKVDNMKTLTTWVPTSLWKFPRSFSGSPCSSRYFFSFSPLRPESQRTGIQDGKGSTEIQRMGFHMGSIWLDQIWADHTRTRWDEQIKQNLQKKTSWKHDLENPWRSFMILQCCCSSMYDPMQSFYKMVGPCWPWSNKKPPLASAAACCAPAPTSESPGAGRASSCSASWSRAPKDRNTGWERYHRNPKEGGSTW